MNRQAARILIKVALTHGQNKLAVHHALRANLEGGGSIYLDNAYEEVSHAMTRNQFDGYLGALKADGVYEKLDGRDFGALAY